MDRLTKYKRRSEPKGDDGSFSFAITLIAVLLSAMLYIINYTENNLILIRQCSYIYILMIVLIVPLLNMLSYIFVKAISLETNSYEDKENLRLIASDYYRSAFRDSILLLLILVTYAFRTDNFIKLVLSFLFCVFIIIYLLRLEDSRPLRKKLLKIKDLKLNKFKEVVVNIIKKIKLTKLKDKKASIFTLKCITVIVIILLLFAYFIFFMRTFFLIFLLLLFIYVIMSQLKVFKPLDLLKTEKFAVSGTVIAALIIIFILPGHILAEMNSVHYKQDKIIPVDITVTGIDSNKVYVDLYQIGHEVPYDSIILHSDANISEEFLSKSENACLCGHYLGQGKYKIFINCSNLNEGSYELSIAKSNIFGRRITTSSTKEDVEDLLSGKRVINSFYLVDNSRTLNINE
jgi:hypothetical protein